MLLSAKSARTAVLLASVAPLAAVTNTNAALVLTLKAGPNPTTTITDNGAGDTDPTVGSIVSVQGSYFGFSTVITVGTSNSPGGPAGILQVQSLDVRNIGGSAGTLTIGLSDTDFIQPGMPGTPLALRSSVAGTLTSGAPAGANSFNFTSFASPANAQPAAAVSTPTQVFVSGTGSPQAFNTDPGFVSDVETSFVHGFSPYSLANLANMLLAPGSQLNFSATTLAVVPEPAMGFLLCMTALTLSRRRRA